MLIEQDVFFWERIFFPQLPPKSLNEPERRENLWVGKGAK